MERPRIPPVLKWYRLYCGALAFVYVVLIVGLIVALFYVFPGGVVNPALEKEFQELGKWFWYGYTGFILGLCLLLGGAYIASFFLPRKPWVWVYHIVLICIGFTSACCLPAAIPLFIYWLKPETKAYFGRI